MKLAGLFVDPKGITLLWNWTLWVEKVVLGLSSYFTWESDFSFSSSFGFSPLAIGLFLTEQDECEKRVESGFGSNETNGHLTTERIISAKGTSACSLKGLFEKLELVHLLELLRYGLSWFQICLSVPFCPLRSPKYQYYAQIHSPVWPLLFVQLRLPLEYHYTGNFYKHQG